MKIKNKSGKIKICYRLWKSFWRYIKSNIITWKYVAYNIVKSLNSSNIGLLLLCNTTLKIAVVYVIYIEYIAIITRGFILEMSVARSIPSYFLWRRYALLSTLLHFSMSWIWWVDFWGGSEMNVPLCTPASLSHSYLECGLQLQLWCSPWTSLSCCPRWPKLTQLPGTTTSQSWSP